MYITIYLNYRGQTEEAINFYRAVLGAELIMISKMGDAPMDIPAHMKERIMHARIRIGDTILYMSDVMDEEKLNVGNNASLALEVETPAKVDEIFGLLSAGGNPKMPPNDAFWGSRFSMLTDKFGIHWMVSCELKKP